MLADRSQKSRIALFVVIFLLADLILVYAKYRRDRPMREEQRLQQQVNALTKGALLYAGDHHYLFPSSDRWQIQLAPYVEKEFLQDTRRIAMNRALSERSYVDVASPMNAILFFQATQSPSAEVEALPLRTDSGQFAACFVSGEGYLHPITARPPLIQRSQEATRPLH